MIKGVIFDFDGLILDTELHEYEVLQEIFQEHECDLPLSKWAELVGTKSDFDPFVFMESQLNRQLDHEALRKLSTERFDQRIASERARPGVEAYLASAKALGLKVGLASSSDSKWISTHLGNLGLLDHFECIRTADNVKNVKPDPALYLQAAECLGLKPEDCLVFEDSANGALAAKRAGMRCVIIPNQVTSGLSFCEVDHRLASMEEMPLDELIRFLHK